VAEAVGLDGKDTKALVFTERITPKERQESPARAHTFHSVAGRGTKFVIALPTHDETAADKETSS